MRIGNRTVIISKWFHSDNDTIGAWAVLTPHAIFARSYPMYHLIVLDNQQAHCFLKVDIFIGSFFSYPRFQVILCWPDDTIEIGDESWEITQHFKAK